MAEETATRFETVPLSEVPTTRQGRTGMAAALRSLSPDQALKWRLEDGETTGNLQARIGGVARGLGIQVTTRSKDGFVYIWLRKKAASS